MGRIPRRMRLTPLINGTSEKLIKNTPGHIKNERVLAINNTHALYTIGS